MLASAPWPRIRWWQLHLLLGAGQIVLWTLAAVFFYRSPEIDSTEQLVWSYALEWGYWKHPPLPSWILHALLAVGGPSVWLPFAATQACIAVALLLTFGLGCEVMQPRRALIAVALTSLVAYHNVGGDSYNHNTVLLPFQAGMTWLFFRATRRQSWPLWIATGAVAGLAMLVKYVALLPIAAALLIMVADRTLHTRRVVVGLLLATGAAGLVVAPHLRWLIANDFLPLRYAREVSEALPGLAATLVAVTGFAAIQVVRLLPFAVGLLFALRTTPTVETAALPDGKSPTMAPRDRLFVTIAGTAPLAITMAAGMFTETALQARWGTNAFLLAGLLAMAWLDRTDSDAMLRRCIAFAVVAQVALCLGQTLTKTVVAERWGRGTRANFPGDVLAADAADVWSLHAAGPLRLVVADIWLGGNIAAHRRSPLAVLIDGDRTKSPWVGARDVDGCGALVLDGSQIDGSVPIPAIEALLQHASASGTWRLPWAAKPLARSAAPVKDVAVRWGVLLPRSGVPCGLVAPPA
jgi:Dolichyl-phosphate-mannose-protein mannosyltransferase